MHGGANALHPVMHGGGYILPRGMRCQRLLTCPAMTAHGLGVPHRGSWRGTPRSKKNKPFTLTCSLCIIRRNAPARPCPRSCTRRAAPDPAKPRRPAPARPRPARGAPDPPRRPGLGPRRTPAPAAPPPAVLRPR